MNRVREAMSRLASRSTEYAGETVWYRRPGVEPLRMMMWRMAESPESAGVDVEVTSRDADWGTATAELDKLPDQRRPKQGDTIVTADGQVYAVRETSFDDAWRYADQTQQIVRIHTQLHGSVQDG